MFLKRSTALFAAAAVAAVSFSGAVAQNDDYDDRGYGYAEFIINLNDANGDGVLTPGEIGPTGAAIFDEIDLNGDGVADRDELADAYVRELDEPDN